MSPVRHLRALQAFDAAATHASLSAAAQALGVTHGAVSRQVKQLEAYLGVALLCRRSNGVEKTAAGETLHVATSQAFSLLEAGLGDVRRVPDRHSIAISLSASLAAKWLVSRLGDFRARHPGVSIFLDTNDAVVDLDRGDVDAALRFGTPGWGNVHCEKLRDEQLVVVSSPSLVTSWTRPMRPEAIAALPLLHDQFDPAWARWAEVVGLDATRIDAPQSRYRDSAVLIAAAVDGQGAALARRLLVSDDLRDGHLVRLDDSAVPLERALYFVCRPGDQDRPVIRDLRDWLVGLD